VFTLPPQLASVTLQNKKVIYDLLLQKLMTVSLDEFLGRLLLHVLPKGFVRIRNFGFLANRRRSALPASTRRAAATTDRTSTLRRPATQSSLHLSQLRRPMIVVESWTAAQIELRFPPPRFMAAA